MEQTTKEKEEAVVQVKSDQTEATNQKSGPNEVVSAEETISSVATKIGDLSYLSEVRMDLPEIKPGNVIRVFYRVIEGGKERIQVFEGTVIAIKNKGIAKTITVRKTSFGIAVERIFPLNSKLIQKIEIKKRQKVRRAKLYYLRKLRGKAARLKELR